MHRTRRRTLTRLAGILLCCLLGGLLSGCGLGTAGGYVPGAKLAGSLAGTKPLDGATISVGSKNFTENILLGKMMLILLKSDGAKVTDLTNIPGSASARQAMLDGAVDVMWEYTGTGWMSYLGHDKPIRNPHKQWEAVRREDLAKNNVVWLPPAPMNDTYGFAVTQQTRRKYGLSTLSDIKKVPVKQRTFCVESEFDNRPDGLKGMLQAYGVPLGQPDGVPESNIQLYQTGAIYDATAQGDCTFGEVYTTDGRIRALDLTVLKDNRHYFPNYNMALVVRRSVLERYPEIRQLVAPVTRKLTNKVLIKLNGEVDVDGREPTDVAYDWLKQEGFID